VDCKGGCWIQLVDRNFQCRTFTKYVVVIGVKYAEWNSGLALYERVTEELVLLVTCLNLNSLRWKNSTVVNLWRSAVLAQE
jgi:hypothetical protein